MKTIAIDNKNEIEVLIRSCKHCVVSTVSPEGMPYSVPMNFAYHDGQIILHSAPTGTHLQNIEQNNHICVVFCTDGTLVYQHKEVACSYRMRAASVICFGKVSFVENEDAKILLMNELMAHYTKNEFKYSKPAIQNVKVWVVEIEKITAKAFAVPHRKTF
jgi:nitroimidazol reductase NimA-like FMN-containing flavoprotein (pyridoxamine 5'-phosphate oxidase superfamily)